MAFLWPPELGLWPIHGHVSSNVAFLWAPELGLWPNHGHVSSNAAFLLALEYFMADIN